MKRTILASLGSILVLSACIDPKSMATPPVTVGTAAGAVQCQLYTKNNTSLDRAIAAPTGMSIKQADAVCHAEGVRRAKL